MLVLLMWYSQVVVTFLEENGLCPDDGLSVLIDRALALFGLLLFSFAIFLLFFLGFVGLCFPFAFTFAFAFSALFLEFGWRIDPGHD